MKLPLSVSDFQSIAWLEPTAHRAWPVCRLLDQTQLPTAEVFIDATTKEHVWDALKRLAVRGAPAIGIAAAYGVVLGTLQTTNGIAPPDAATVRRLALEAVDYLATARPTAVNLFAALNRMRTTVETLETKGTQGSTLTQRLLTEARAIHAEDAALCAAIGQFGAPLITDGIGVLTICNTGKLATGGIGTALGILTTAWDAGRRFKVFACETRPLLQGARLTAWELMRHGVDVTLLTDSMAGLLMRQRRVNLVVVGADRIARNGDTANKIGTFMLAVLAKHHGLPFYVAAPRTTFDCSLATGDAIPIEQRASSEVLTVAGVRLAPEVAVYNPAFDVTPGELITAFITDRGILHPPFESLT